MGMTGQQGPTQASLQQITTVTPHIQPPYTNQSGVTVYQLDASAIQALLAQATEAAGGSARGGPQEDNKDDGGSDFKVSEGEKHSMRKMCGMEDTMGNECLQKQYIDLFVKHQDEKYEAKSHRHRD